MSALRGQVDKARVFAGILLGGLLVLGCVRDGRERPPNLLIVSVDTLRADALGVAGHAPARTPHIDRLAAEGVYFTQAITPVPRTTPALGSLLSGVWPKRHGSRDVGDAIAADLPTLATVLQARGYRTLAVSANDSAGPKQHLDRGFDRFVAYGDLVDRYAGRLYRDLTEVPPDGMGWATATTDETLELLAEVPAEHPWFAWVFYFDPHFFYRPPSPWQDGVAAEACWQLYAYFGAHRGEAGQLFSDVGGVSSRALADCRRLYDAEVAYTDHEIGRLLAELERTGRLANTFIVFVADHGENLGEGGLFFEHGDNVHDAGLRVPLVFNGPGLARGRRDDGAVSLVDVVPTLLSLLAVPAAERPAVDGSDLSPRLLPDGTANRRDLQRVVFAESGAAIWNEAVDHVITGRTWWRVCINDPRFTLCEIPNEKPGVYTLYDHVADPKLSQDVAGQYPDVVAALRQAWQRWPPESARERVARTARFKLVERPLLAGGYQPSLYDLAADPAESRDVQAEHPEIFRYLSAKLAAWTADLRAPSPRQPDPELEASLRALGYVP